MAKRRENFTAEDMAEVLDNPEWTEEDFARAKRFAEALPDLAASLDNAAIAKEASTKISISLQLDRDVVEKFRKSGPDWRGQINSVLRKAAGL
jgi:uncharacterized protein (DUF4415 family)